MKAMRFILVLALGTLAGCHSTGPMGTTSLSELKNLHATGSLAADNNGLIRAQGLEDAALSIGAQSGLAWRASQINGILQDHSKEFDQIFDFNRLMLPNYVLPPVLQTSAKNMKVDSPNTIRLSDQTYLILTQAKFVSVAPNWREYLWMNFKAPDAPPDNMLPKTALEQRLWQEYVARGWQQGVQQADMILRDNLARLTRDMKGMVLYRKLLAQNMVSLPFVKTSDLGVTGSGESLRINDQILQITALPQLQVDPSKWKAVMVPQTPADGAADE
ncbi:MAG: dotC [Gammaproteobacteria bacterium]|jgi:defect-in-organelle-trafficking protein DotC|nr:dotC [Gammaproteobacteria bacterium]